ncbi:MAG: hypothetical protein ABI646_03395 [Acidobacteriota bacterium]
MRFHDRTLILALHIVLLPIAGSYQCFAQPLKPVYFDEVLEKRLSTEAKGTEWNLERFCPVSSSIVSLRVLQSYGAVFVANDSVRLPPTCVYKGDAAVVRFQKSLQKMPLDINGIRVELQTGAAQALESAIGEAAAIGASISAFDGLIAGSRSYGDTLMLWNSRLFPGMEFWIKRGRLSPADRDSIARLDQPDKVAKVLEWESQGIFFSTDRTRSIFTSTAPPGASQHLALLAFDVTEYWNPKVQAILNRNGWFQTVVDDPVHFTFLGFPEYELPSRGLIAVSKGGRQYWVPNLPPPTGPAKTTN